MRDFIATPLTSERFELGEGIRWDDVREELVWVDIVSSPSRMFRARAGDAGLEVLATYEFDQAVTVCAPFADRKQGWLIGNGQYIVHLREDGSRSDVARLEESGPVFVRTNDGAADPWGRFWVGTMGSHGEFELGSLYRYDGASVQQMRTNCSIPNGLTWSPDREFMYFTDSVLGTIFRYDVDDDGTPSNPQPFIVLPDPAAAAPDGHCVDANGHLWVAIWGGREVREYNEAGELVGRVAVDARQVSCCTIGGPNGTTLYITTAQEGYSDQDRFDDPHAGKLFSCDIGVAGRPIGAVA